MVMMKRNALVNLTIVMWRHAKGCRIRVALYAILACSAILVSLSMPLIIARFMNAAQQLEGEALIAEASYLMGIFLLTQVIFWLLHGPSRIIETVVAFHIRQASQTSLFGKAAALPMRWHNAHHSGETIDQVARASQALHEFTGGSFEVIHLLTRFIGAVGLLCWIMPQAGLAVVVIGILAMMTIILFDRKLAIQYTLLNKRFNEIAAAIQDYLSNIVTIKSLRLEQRVTDEVHERTGRILPLYKKNVVLNELKWFTSGSFVEITRGGVMLAYVVVMVKSGELIEVGTLYALYEYLRSVGDSFSQFTHKYGNLVVMNSRIEAIEHIEVSFEHEVRQLDQAVLPTDWQTVSIQNLHFSHDSRIEGKRPAGLERVGFELQSSKSYALVGESGSGKSTVLSLLRGIHEPQQAQVSVDGVDLLHGLSHIAHHTTLIPQDPELFSDTILFNITLGLEASEEQLERALEVSRFEPVVSRLEKGLLSSIAEKGVSLSGGEKQRLALARGLFFADRGDSEIILLDEPTSSVDIYNERRIYEDVLRQFSDRCVLSAIHRFHLLHLFDCILVFERGKLVEQGSLEQLLFNGGEFSRLWKNYKSSEEERKLIA